MTEIQNFPQPASGVGQVRCRGAQPGNKNAMKHGYYARRLPPEERKDVHEAARVALDQEILILRVFIRRVLAMGAAAQDTAESLSCLRAISMAAMAINRLVRTQVQLIQPHENDGVFHQALEEALLEIGLQAENPDPREAAQEGTSLGLFNPGGIWPSPPAQ